MSVTGNLYNPMALAVSLPEDKPVVFVIGAMAAGHITVNQHPYVRTLSCWVCTMCVFVLTWTHTPTLHAHIHATKQIEEMISVSDFPLSGATAINRILGAIESNWGIV